MTARVAGAPGERGPVHAASFQGLRRARRRLWILSLLGVLVGAVLHHWVARSLGARLLGLAAVAASLAPAWRRVLAFPCPRCGGVFLTTGSWRDFFGLTRILWGTRCGRCALSALEEEPPSSGRLADSRPT